MGRRTSLSRIDGVRARASNPLEDLAGRNRTVHRRCRRARYTAILLSGGRRMSAFLLLAMARGLALLPMFGHDLDQLERLKQRSNWIGIRRTGPRWRLRRERAATRVARN
jgi:hypothetical protein